MTHRIGSTERDLQLLNLYIENREKHTFLSVFYPNWRINQILRRIGNATFEKNDLQREISLLNRAQQVLKEKEDRSKFYITMANVANYI
jgi:hypothetical protein